MTMFDVIFVPLVPLGILIGLALVGGVATVWHGGGGYRGGGCVAWPMRWSWRCWPTP
jgi:hypothetical protein